MYNLLASAVPLNPITAAKILALAGLAYAVLQGLKKSFPAISGVASVVINVALAVVGAVVIIPPAQLFSIETLTTLLVAGIAAAGAAGIHGTIKNFTTLASAPPSQPEAPVTKNIQP
jgi:hypothetical protein